MSNHKIELTKAFIYLKNEIFDIEIFELINFTFGGISIDDLYNKYVLYKGWDSNGKFLGIGINPKNKLNIPKDVYTVQGINIEQIKTQLQ